MTECEATMSGLRVGVRTEERRSLECVYWDDAVLILV